MLVFVGSAADGFSKAALREGTRIADYLTERPGGPGATSGGVKAGPAGRPVSSRRNTTRAVIMRTIIDGTTDMRESPIGLCFLCQVGDGFDQEFAYRAFLLPNPSQSNCFMSRGNKADLTAPEMFARHFVKTSIISSPA